MKKQGSQANQELQSETVLSGRNVCEHFSSAVVRRRQSESDSPHFYFILPFKFNSKPLLLRPTLDTGSVSLLLILTVLHC